MKDFNQGTKFTLYKCDPPIIQQYFLKNVPKATINTHF